MQIGASETDIGPAAARFRPRRPGVQDIGTPIARRIAFSISIIRVGERPPPSGGGARRSRRSVVICSHFAIEGRSSPSHPVRRESVPNREVTAARGLLFGSQSSHSRRTVSSPSAAQL